MSVSIVTNATGRCGAFMQGKPCALSFRRCAALLVLYLALTTSAWAQTPTATLISSDATASELGAGTASFTATRSGASVAAALSVFFTIGGTAGNSIDYTFISGSLSIPAGQSSATVTISPIADNLVEGEETITITLNANANYLIGTPGSVSLTIADDPAIVTLVASDATASEVGLTSGAFSFARSGGDIGAAMGVSLMRGGTAGNSVDYEFAANTISFPAGQTGVTQRVIPIADNLVEASETVTLALVDSSSYLIGNPRNGTVTISDDPPVVVLSVPDAAAAELGGDPGTFQFSRSGGDIGSALNVSLTRGGTAGNSVDYVFLAASISIPSGQFTVMQMVTPLADNLVEGPETSIVTINASSNYTVSGSPSASISIADDPPILSLVVSDASADENGLDAGAITFTRSGGDIGSALQFGLLRGGSAANSSDYVFLPNSLSIPAGQSSVMQAITPVADNEVEGDETVTTSLVASSAYLIGAAGSGSVLIADDPAVVTINVTDPVALERDSDPGSFVITRGGGDIGSGLSVSFSRSGSASPGTDYAFIGNSVSIPAGSSSVPIVVVPVFDLVVEGDETVQIALTATSSYLIDTPSTAVITIVDFLDAVFADQFD